MGLSFSVLTSPPVKSLRREGNQRNRVWGREGRFQSLPGCGPPHRWFLGGLGVVHGVGTLGLLLPTGLAPTPAFCSLLLLSPLAALASHVFQEAGEPAPRPPPSFLLQEPSALFPLPVFTCRVQAGLLPRPSCHQDCLLGLVTLDGSIR